MTSRQSIFLIDGTAQGQLTEFAHEALGRARGYYASSKGLRDFALSYGAVGTNQHVTVADLSIEPTERRVALKMTIHLTVVGKELSVAESRAALLAMTEGLGGVMVDQGDYWLAINVLRTPNEARPQPDRQRP